MAADHERLEECAMGLMTLLERGGPTMYAIVAVALVGITLFIERWLSLRGLIPEVLKLTREVRETAGDLGKVVSKCSSATHSLAPMLGLGVEASVGGGDREEVLRAMSREGRRVTMRIRRGLGVLAMLGTMAPFLGLLGTVLGIMQALSDLGDATAGGGAAGYAAVAKGVSEALVTTAAGIIVAVVLVMLHQALRAKLTVAILELQLMAEEIADLLSAKGVSRTEGANE